jgi:hypothetical protein
MSEMFQKTQEQFKLLQSKVDDLKEERKIQLKTVDQLVVESRDKDLDQINVLGFQLVDSLRKVSCGNTGALLSLLSGLSGGGSCKLNSSSACLTKELEVAVLNLLGMSASSSDG